MFQTFDAPTSPDQGPPRLAQLRKTLKDYSLDGLLVPRADAWQGEYVAPCDERLAWLTGFTGSAGFCAVLAESAGVFIDGRYRVQVKEQVADVFTPVPWPEVGLADWLLEQAPKGAVIGFDPWLHTIKEIAALRDKLNGQLTLQPTENKIDLIWSDRPNRPHAPVTAHPIELSGQSSVEKRETLAKGLRGAGHNAAVLTLPDSICWLLNIRGNDIPRIPITQAYAILHADASVDLFIDPGKTDDLGPDPSIRQHPFDAFLSVLDGLNGPVRADTSSAPVIVEQTLGDKMVAGDDPCVMPKARKNPTELEGMRAAHRRDAVAMVEFLAWLDAQTPSELTEIDVVTALEGFRAGTNALRDISFETISGSGPNAAIVHYRVSHDTNRRLRSGELLLVDSGGQYIDGTTDITRTIALGDVGNEERICFTRVLQGMIAISRIRFPKGVAGAHIDTLARAPLWMAGQDYDHGTGHGVGSYLSVHEGPARISRVSNLPLQPGMILSNEPGYYREGAFGIRIENLIVVQEAPTLAGGDNRAMYDFETLTHVPIDRSLIVPEMLSHEERQWINSYHAICAEQLEGKLSDRASAWLSQAVHPV
ncbi:aminopeptidase P family protein [Shimia ponticola]|uniref:aminopeptidase P family protein n=1 Tax=Shimia ponticola TaxID=2582893 RepID=UPI0011BF401D|nr:aminopeptidase P family protein [Shimia ponticola]